MDKRALVNMGLALIGLVLFVGGLSLVRRMRDEGPPLLFVSFAVLCVIGAWGVIRFVHLRA